MKEFEKYIESIKMLADKNYISLGDYVEIVKKLCEEYGEDRVMNAIRTEFHIK